MKDILIVEDLPHVMVWISESVQQAFPQACLKTATTVAEAKLQVQQNAFNLVLLDIGLPDGSGLDLIPNFLESNHACLIVVSTLFDDDVHVFKALRLGAKGYILKDESKAQLSEMLFNINNGQQPISPAIANKLLNFFSPKPSTVKLSPRETEVLTAVAKGFSVPETANMLAIKKSTCYGYIKSIYNKLSINSRAEAALEATKMGLIDPRHD